MDNLDNIFKNNFRGEEEGLSSSEESQLWDAIVDDLGDENSIVISSSNWYSRKWLLLFLLIPMAYFIGKQQVIQTSKQEKEYKIYDQSNINLNKSKETIMELGQEKQTDNRIENDLILVNNNKGESLNNLNAEIKNSIIRDVHQKQNTGSNLIETKSDLNQNSLSFSHERMNKDLIDLISSANIFKDNLEEESLGLISENKQLHIKVYSDPLEKQNVEQIKEIPGIALPEQFVEKSEQRHFSFYTSISAGVNRSGIYYSGPNESLVDLKNKTERAYYGESYGADIGLIYNNKWTISAGVYHEVHRTVFDYEGFRDLNRSVDTHVKGILIDYESKAVIEEYVVDTTINVSSYNRLKNINAFSYLTIPVNIAWQKNQGRFSYGLSLGTKLMLI